MHSNSGTPTTGISNVTFHSGFKVLGIVGVDCRASPSVTTKYCRRESFRQRQRSRLASLYFEEWEPTGSLVPPRSLAARSRPYRYMRPRLADQWNCGQSFRRAPRARGCDVLTHPNDGDLEDQRLLFWHPHRTCAPTLTGSRVIAFRTQMAAETLWQW